MNTRVINPSKLRPAPWRATHLLKPDVALLTQSITKYGLLSPLIIQKSSGIVIDGFHRLLAISFSPELTKKFSSGIECHVMAIDDIDAMIMHIQINRPRVNVLAKGMSSIIKTITQSRAYSIEEIDELFNMNVMESELLLDGSLLKMRKIKEHVYSPAWVPIEAPTNNGDSITLEKPPNPDR